MKEVLVEMLEIYQPKGVDWMGYQVTMYNPYTFHHIIEKRYGGKTEIKNGAILTRNAHNYLNYLDQYCPEAYEEYQKLFRFINSLNGPIPDELYEDIYYLAYQIQNEGIYKFRDNPRDFKKEAKEKRKEKSLVKSNRVGKKKQLF